MEKFTVKTIRDNDGDVHENIKWAQSQYGNIPTEPEKPVLKHQHSSKQLKEYTRDFKRYESLKKEYGIINTARDVKIQEIDVALEQYIKEEAGLFEHVPKKSQGKVYWKAYSDGHASGFYEIYNCLIELVDLFKGDEK